MASLLEKTQTLIQANLHEMVDRALEANSVAVMKQYARDAEKNLQDLEDAAATVGGEVKTMERKYLEYKKKADQLDRNIDVFLMQGKEDLARAAQNEMNSNRRLQEQYHEQWVRQKREYEALLNARLKLQARLKEIRQEQRELESLMKLAKSKEQTVKTIKSLDDLVGAGDADMARLGESIRSRLDKASAHAEMYASRLDTQMDDVLGKGELDIQLEERKRRLGLAQPPSLELEDEGEDAAAMSSDI
ncbi:MAG: PspA/IM30 family protein [Ardenticatenaceae bacterium]|nr:PspA/IM30 family protein [Anaerolineales bacterium]MCB8922808.1 PspA/IM30 family protein [Ardenticatenaceae bacterium]MCB8991941.1 PspA/IM30 family protein [Ardenticatenaceae bacterium]MCB9004751.1 PspA/IM30 family protein [Ardenticatenaceae bacterium]